VELPVCFSPSELLPFSFTADERGLLVRERAGVQVFELATGEQEDFLAAPQNVSAVALSPDGQTLAWSLEDGTVQLIRLSGHEVLNTLEGEQDPVHKLRFSPIGDKLFQSAHSGQIRIWDAHGNPLSPIETGQEVVGIGLSPDGTSLVTIPFDGVVQLWEVATGESIRGFEGGAGYDTSDAVFSPDGQYLAADLATGVFLWEASDASLLWNDVKNSMAIAYSPDGQFFAYSNIDDNNSVVLASPDGRQTKRILEGIQGPVFELFFSAEGSRLAATDGSEIRVWDSQDGTLISIGRTSCP
jgi:WD40 repeat protein